MHTTTAREQLYTTVVPGTDIQATSFRKQSVARKVVVTWVSNEGLQDELPKGVIKIHSERASSTQQH